MNKLEAYQLLDAIEYALGTNTARVHQIGNGEHVVILQKGGYWLWSVDDWQSSCEQAGLPARQIHVEGRRETNAAIDTTEIYTLHLPVGA